jgi:hypothetical protein
LFGSIEKTVRESGGEGYFILPLQMGQNSIGTKMEEFQKIGG